MKRWLLFLLLPRHSTWSAWHSESSASSFFTGTAGTFLLIPFILTRLLRRGISPIQVHHVRWGLTWVVCALGVNVGSPIDVFVHHANAQAATIHNHLASIIAIPCPNPCASMAKLNRFPQAVVSRANSKEYALESTFRHWGCHIGVVKVRSKIMQSGAHATRPSVRQNSVDGGV